MGLYGDVKSVPQDVMDKMKQNHDFIDEYDIEHDICGLYDAWHILYTILEDTGFHDGVLIQECLEFGGVFIDNVTVMMASSKLNDISDKELVERFEKCLDTEISYYDYYNSECPEEYEERMVGLTSHFHKLRDFYQKIAAKEHAAIFYAYM